MIQLVRDTTQVIIELERFLEIQLLHGRATRKCQCQVSCLAFLQTKVSPAMICGNLERVRIYGIAHIKCIHLPDELYTPALPSYNTSEYTSLKP